MAHPLEGYAVTNRGAPPADATIQTVRTGSLCCSTKSATEDAEGRTLSHVKLGMLAMAKRRHHYTPASYLANFTDPSGVLHVVRLATGERFRAVPKDVGLERDFYRPTHLQEGDDPDVFEDAFADLESDCSPILRSIIGSRALPDDDDSLSLLYNFVALQDARTPQARKMTDGPRIRTAEIILDLLRSDPGIYEGTAKNAGINLAEHPYESFKDFKGKYTLKIPTEAFVHDMMTRMDTVLQFLHLRKWTVLYSDRPGEQFVVSDDPVALMWSQGNITSPPGHAHHNTDLTIPLASSVALVGRYEGKPRVIEAQRNTVASINTRTIASGRKFVAGASPDFVLMFEGQVITSHDLVRQIESGKLRIEEHSVRTSR